MEKGGRREAVGADMGGMVEIGKRYVRERCDAMVEGGRKVNWRRD